MTVRRTGDVGRRISERAAAETDEVRGGGDMTAFRGVSLRSAVDECEVVRERGPSVFASDTERERPPAPRVSATDGDRLLSR